ncbi:MAG: 3'-5' exonuclease [Lentisphaeria bacterium]|nr:3'-5' exonuclease [Lentisphaeria bacterium]
MRWFELGPFTVFDVETTGMSPVRDRIVQIGAVRIDRDGFISRYQSLVNPGRQIPPGVICVHHITDEMVADAPNFAAVGRDFLAFADHSTLVAHNARFDLGFLQESLARTGLPLWKGRTLDTLRLIKTTHPGLPSYRLQSLRAIFQLASDDTMQAHRADADVEWTLQILEIALNAALKAHPPAVSKTEQTGGRRTR